MKSLFALGLAAGLICAAAPASHAASITLLAAAPAAQNSNIILAADGCGWGFYRGPYGACHQYGTGAYPGGYNGAYIAPNGYYAYGNQNNGCPNGYWRGPWGACRDTHYVGPLPNGGYQY